MRREISLIKSLTKQSGLKRVEEKLSNRESGKKFKKNLRDLRVKSMIKY
jgi:hypothetical protein